MQKQVDWFNIFPAAQSAAQSLFSFIHFYLNRYSYSAPGLYPELLLAQSSTGYRNDSYFPGSRAEYAIRNLFEGDSIFFINRLHKWNQ